MSQITDVFYRLTALFLLILFSPLLFIFYLLVKLTSKGPFIFKQKRLGKEKKIFTLYKIRTMVDDAEELKGKCRHLNETDGPVFKIREDPRYTKIGKFLSHTALDELPQLINVIRGEMSFVGSRPLPVEEGLKVPKKYERRFSVLPGITSSWIIKGAHKLTFDQWMRLDLDYVKKKSFCYDIKILSSTVILIAKFIINKLLKKDV
ncbi:sugar transferase [Candidatus Gribaldobacteria bacterium]|nr:sugar transferase [Candidatus Gribaldobacteria bacterium]